MEELISKKELLQLYSISYGALYRWKRMGLIPDSWFIRKSTPTGQETYFNREQICERIDLIISRGNDAKLTDLADELSEQKAATITIKTKYSTKEYPLSEVVEIVIDDGRQKNVIYGG